MAAKDNWVNDEYEHDTRWTAVDEYTMSHLHPSSRSNAKDLDATLENIRKNGIPDDSTYPAFGKFIALQCKMSGVKHVLEVGLLGGYTAIWIATLNPDIHITCLEIDPHNAKVARQNVDNSGVGKRVEIIEGPALDSLVKIEDEIKKGTRPRFGYVFIDADKPNNWAYFDKSADITLPGSCILVDNVVRKGNLANADPVQDIPNTHGGRKVVEMAGKDPRVDGCVIQTVCEKNYDGFLMAVVK